MQGRLLMEDTDKGQKGSLLSSDIPKKKKNKKSTEEANERTICK